MKNSLIRTESPRVSPGATTSRPDLKLLNTPDVQAFVLGVLNNGEAASDVNETVAGLSDQQAKALQYYLLLREQENVAVKRIVALKIKGVAKKFIAQAEQKQEKLTQKTNSIAVAHKLEGIVASLNLDTGNNQKNAEFLLDEKIAEIIVRSEQTLEGSLTRMTGAFLAPLPVSALKRLSLAGKQTELQEARAYNLRAANVQTLNQKVYVLERKMHVLGKRLAVAELTEAEQMQIEAEILAYEQQIIDINQQITTDLRKGDQLSAKIIPVLERSGFVKDKKSDFATFEESSKKAMQAMAELTKAVEEDRMSPEAMEAKLQPMQMTLLTLAAALRIAAENNPQLKAFLKTVEGAIEKVEYALDQLSKPPAIEKVQTGIRGKLKGLFNKVAGVFKGEKKRKIAKCAVGTLAFLAAMGALTPVMSGIGDLLHSHHGDFAHGGNDFGQSFRSGAADLMNTLADLITPNAYADDLSGQQASFDAQHTTDFDLKSAHAVAGGESLWGIAKKFNANWQDLGVSKDGGKTWQSADRLSVSKKGVVLIQPGWLVIGPSQLAQATSPSLVKAKPVSKTDVITKDKASEDGLSPINKAEDVLPSTKPEEELGQPAMPPVAKGIDLASTIPDGGMPGDVERGLSTEKPDYVQPSILPTDEFNADLASGWFPLDTSFANGNGTITMGPKYMNNIWGAYGSIDFGNDSLAVGADGFVGDGMLTGSPFFTVANDIISATVAGVFTQAKMDHDLQLKDGSTSTVSRNHGKGGWGMRANANLEKYNPLIASVEVKKTEMGTSTEFLTSETYRDDSGRKHIVDTKAAGVDEEYLRIGATSQEISIAGDVSVSLSAGYQRDKAKARIPNGYTIIEQGDSSVEGAVYGGIIHFGDNVAVSGEGGNGYWQTGLQFNPSDTVTFSGHYSQTEAGDVGTKKEFGGHLGVELTENWGLTVDASQTTYDQAPDNWDRGEVYAGFTYAFGGGKSKSGKSKSTARAVEAQRANRAALEQHMDPVPKTVIAQKDVRLKAAEAPVNLPPNVLEISSSSKEVVLGQVFEVDIVVTDPEGDKIKICDGGSDTHLKFLRGSDDGKKAYFEVIKDGGVENPDISAWLTVYVTDGHGNTVKSDNLWVQIIKP